METNAVRERLSFVRDLQTGQWSISELCERYGVSRPTGYKWLRRVELEGEAGLEDRSRRPWRSPDQTPAWVETLILQLRRKEGWGAKKILQHMRNRYPTVSRPARSTVNRIFDRHGLLKKKRRRRRWKHPGAMPLETERPNQVWPSDFKGQFRTKDGVYCYPLTVTDHFSRKLLLCRALPSVRTIGAKPSFRRLFREVGLPEAIRTDNGAPFASTGIHGLCELNVWWMQLGIVHQRIYPGRPHENGQHERMHRDLKDETTHPPAWNLRGQQRKFNHFQQRYNEDRPHDGIDGDVPNQRWAPSPREYPERILPPEYPGPMEVRRVSNAGTFRLHKKQPFLCNALQDQYIGLEEVGDGIWNIVYYRTLLGRIDERTGLITGVNKV